MDRPLVIYIGGSESFARFFYRGNGRHLQRNRYSGRMYERPGYNNGGCESYACNPGTGKQFTGVLRNYH